MKSAYQLFKNKVDPKEIGNPKLRQQLMQLYKQNQYEQLQQVNANFQAGLAQGLTPGQAATTWVLPTGPNSTYTVKDGQNMADIAKMTGANPVDIVNANPDMKSPQTGMVIKIPSYSSSAAMQGVSGLNGTYPAGGIGQPSNAAYGQTTTNPQGTNPLKPGASEIASASAWLFNPQSTPGRNVQGGGNMNVNPTPGRNVIGGFSTANPLRPGSSDTAWLLNPNSTPGRNVIGGGNMNVNFTPGRNVINGFLPTQPTPTPAGPQIQPPSPSPTANNADAQRFTAQAQWFKKFQAHIGDPNAQWTQNDIKFAVQYGWIKPKGTTSPADNQNVGIAFPKGNKYNSLWNHPPAPIKKSGGGHGGGGGVPPRYTQEQSQPAFASGSAFNGLINWRI